MEVLQWQVNRNPAKAWQWKSKFEFGLDENGEVVMCEVITILTVAGKDYIALLPKGQENKEEQDVWFYGYSENPDDPNEEPELIYIESDDEYEAVEDAFDEYLDECEFDEF